MAVRHYQELIAWQKAMAFVVSVCRLTKLFPRDERYGLTNQLRRAAVSVPSNIAEGQGCGVGSAFRQFLRIATGSVQEAETQILIAQQLDFVNEKQCGPSLTLAAEVRRILAGLIKSISDN